jgi:hypothetical protein
LSPRAILEGHEPVHTMIEIGSQAWALFLGIIFVMLAVDL